jgi:hypothetical protein
MDGLSNLTLVVSLGATTGFLRVPMRSCLLMCRMRVILRLKVFGLVWGTFAIPSHEFSKFEGRLQKLVFTPVARGLPLIHRKQGVT